MSRDRQRCISAADSVDTIQEWLNSIKNAPDSKAVHLLIQRIEAKRTENKTDFNIESTLKPVLEKVVAGEGLRSGISVSELSRRMGKTNQAFGQKIKRGTFTVDEMKAVAKAVGCTYEGTFILSDGSRIEY